jgi:hypothetical protein
MIRVGLSMTQRILRVAGDGKHPHKISQLEWKFDTPLWPRDESIKDEPVRGVRHAFLLSYQTAHPALAICGIFRIKASFCQRVGTLNQCDQEKREWGGVKLTFSVSGNCTRSREACSGDNRLYEEIGGQPMPLFIVAQHLRGMQHPSRCRLNEHNDVR